jgi:hypothetical protein
MSSLFVRVTLVPTVTVIACGPKAKLSIFGAQFATERWSVAVTRDDPTGSSSIAISTTLAIRTFPSPFCLSPYL